jgi:hypothetical protein
MRMRQFVAGSRRPSATRITRTATTSRQIQLGVKLLF